MSSMRSDERGSVRARLSTEIIESASVALAVSDSSRNPEGPVKPMRFMKKAKSPRRSRGALMSARRLEIAMCEGPKASVVASESTS